MADLCRSPNKRGDLFIDAVFFFEQFRQTNEIGHRHVSS
jgi:hypothetical protein